MSLIIPFQQFYNLLQHFCLLLVYNQSESWKPHVGRKSDLWKVRSCSFTKLFKSISCLLYGLGCSKVPLKSPAITILCEGLYFIIISCKMSRYSLYSRCESTEVLFVGKYTDIKHSFLSVESSIAAILSLPISSFFFVFFF